MLGAIIGLMPLFTKILDLIPDPDEKARMQKMLFDFEAEMAKGQTDINAVEAAHSNLFVAGWRPFIGWACGAAFVWQMLGLQLYNWIASAMLWPLAPAMDASLLMTVLMGMLGLGGLRTYEKTQGIADTVVNVFKRKK